MRHLQQIIQEEGVGASIILHEPGFSEYLNYITPPYSCAKINAEHLIFDSKQSEYPSREAQMKAINDTVNMFQHFQELSGRMNLQYKDAILLLGQHFEIINDEGTHTSQTEIDN